MRWKGLKASLIEAATVNGLILFIIIAATYFTYVVGSTNVASLLQDLVTGSGISPWMVILAINIILLILGCIIDPITITLLTVPIFLPVVQALGFDPIWFGVVFCVNTQIGLITPPMGTDLFAVKTIFNIPTTQILKGVFPFLVSELVFLAVLCVFPQISLWLPALSFAK
jgi:C4-dicarboxylate transporter, DctM subunit